MGHILIQDLVPLHCSVSINWLFLPSHQPCPQHTGIYQLCTARGTHFYIRCLHLYFMQAASQSQRKVKQCSTLAIHKLVYSPLNNTSQLSSILVWHWGQPEKQGAIISFLMVLLNQIYLGTRQDLISMFVLQYTVPYITITQKTFLPDQIFLRSTL